MISVIIPTLLKVDRLETTLNELSSCDFVGEIIVINNTIHEKLYNIPKVKEIFLGKNIYVNPSWNLGYNLSSFDKLCFLNDDVWFNWNKLYDISTYITEENGIIGMSNDNYYECNDSFDIVPYNGYRPIGYGCCFFIHKNNYDYIPNSMKIWCGDDWIFYRSTNQNYIIKGLKCSGYISKTVDDKLLSQTFETITNNDMSEMIGYIKSNQIFNYLIGTKWWLKN